MESLKNKKVRLSSGQILFIKELAKKYFSSDDVRIFGSRAQITKKGGDIDIYIRTEKSKDILKNKILFLTEFQKKFGIQKIDLVVEYKGAQFNSVFEEAKREGVKL